MARQVTLLYFSNITLYLICSLMKKHEFPYLVLIVVVFNTFVCNLNRNYILEVKSASPSTS